MWPSEIWDYYFNAGHTGFFQWAFISFVIGLFLGRFLGRRNFILFILLLGVLAPMLNFFFMVSVKGGFHKDIFLMFQMPFLVGFLIYTTRPMVRVVQRML